MTDPRRVAAAGLVVVGVVAAVGLAATFTRQGHYALSLSLTTVTIRQLDAGEDAARVELEFENPGAWQLTVKRLFFNLQHRGGHYGTYGLTQVDRSVPPGGSLVLALPVPRAAGAGPGAGEGWRLEGFAVLGIGPLPGEYPRRLRLTWP